MLPNSRPKYLARKAINLKISWKIPTGFYKCSWLRKAVHVVQGALLVDRASASDQAVRAVASVRAGELPVPPETYGMPLSRAVVGEQAAVLEVMAEARAQAAVSGVVVAEAQGEAVGLAALAEVVAPLVGAQAVVSGPAVAGEEQAVGPVVAG